MTQLYSSMDEQFLSQVNNIISENIGNENFSVEDLAKSVNLSRSMLHRKMIKITGKSASEYITEKRLLKAKELLENKVATVSEVAYNVGFNSPSYFIKVFKNHFKVSPGELKKRNLLNDGNFSDLEKVDMNSRIITKRNIIIVILLIVVLPLITIYYLGNREPEQKSIAVLPIHNLTGHDENAYFVDGMHDALIGELGRISSVRVISRTSTLKFRESEMLLSDIAKELGVNTVVEGSVYCAGDSLCFMVQLIDVYPEESHLLANEYYEEMGKVLHIQNRAVKDIAGKIKIKLTESEKNNLTKAHSVNPETYKAYLRGMYYLNKGTVEDFETGIKYLQEAIGKDPGEPFAYAALALGYATAGHGQLNPEQTFIRASAAAQKAINLDPTIPEAYTALAMLYLYNAWDLPSAREAFENAIFNQPNNEIAHAHFAWYYVLNNNKDKAIYHAKKATMIEPLSPAYKSWLALIYCYFEEYEEAEYWAEKSFELNENIPYGNFSKGWTCLQKDEYQKAIEYANKIPEYDWYWKMLKGYIYLKAGERERALEYYNNMVEYSKNNWVNYAVMGMMAANLGFSDKAFEYLEKAVEQKLYPLNFINFYPSSENIRLDPRYNDLMHKLNLPTNNMLVYSK